MNAISIRCRCDQKFTLLTRPFNIQAQLTNIERKKKEIAEKKARGIFPGSSKGKSTDTKSRHYQKS